LLLYIRYYFSDNVVVERTSFASPSNEDSFLKNQSKDITNSGKKKKSISGRIKDSCNVNLLRRRLPIVGWLPNYNWNYSVFDLIAGITVGLTIIPQSIAYAGVAGLPFEVLT
jgi:Sulfate permease family